MYSIKIGQTLNVSHSTLLMSNTSIVPFVMTFEMFSHFAIVSEQSDFIFVYDTRDANLYLHACIDPATPQKIRCLQWSGTDASQTIESMRTGLDLDGFGSTKPVGAIANDRMSRRFGYPEQPSNFGFRMQIEFDGLGRQIASLRLLCYAPTGRPQGSLCLLLAKLESEAIAAEAHASSAAPRSAPRL